MNDLNPRDSLPRSRPMWLVWGARFLLTLCAAVAVYCWFWVATIGLAFGPNLGFWTQLAGLSVALGAMIVLSRWLVRRIGPFQSPLKPVALLLLAWTLLGALVWYGLCSPFARSGILISEFAATTWWILWAWLMFFVRWRPLPRAATMAGLLFVASAFFIAVRADGLDGDTLPRLAWRFAPRARWEPNTQPAPSLGMPSVESLPHASSEIHAAKDFPRFRGTTGLGIVHGTRLARDWQQDPPRLKWRRPVGAAWSSIAVAGPLVYTQEQRGDKECITCYDRETGNPRWVHQDDAYYQNATTGDGPRATPTVDGNQVFALGATGILNALNAQTGSRLWSLSVVEDTAATAPSHGMVSSPLVVGKAVVVCAGGPNASLVAYDRESGARLWAAGSDPAGYTSPLLVELAGTMQIVAVTPDHIHGHVANSGEILWTVPFGNEHQTNCSQPFPVGPDELFASSGYGTGGTLIKVNHSERWSANTQWANRTLQTKFSSPVVHAGYAYGLDNGILECVSLADGNRQWKHGRYGHGQLLLVEDLLLIQAEDGRVALVKAQPELFEELASFPTLRGQTWNYPALAGSELFVRNDREIACYEIPLEPR